MRVASGTADEESMMRDRLAVATPDKVRGRKKKKKKLVIKTGSFHIQFFFMCYCQGVRPNSTIVKSETSIHMWPGKLTDVQSKFWLIGRAGLNQLKMGVEGQWCKGQAQLAIGTGPALGNVALQARVLRPSTIYNSIL